MYIEKVLDIWVQLMKNGGKNKNVAFIILFSINTKKETVKSKLKGSENVQHLYLFYCFTIVLFSLGILQALYFSLILSRSNFLLRCFMTLYQNCKLKLWTFKAGSTNIYGVFIKYNFVHIHLTKEFCKHLNFSHFTLTSQKMVQWCWMFQGLIIANADVCSG